MMNTAQSAQAWVRLPSGRKMNILDPDPDAWDDADLAIGLSRTFRWGGYSNWSMPLSVAQHSISVLILAVRASNRPLTKTEQLRELLHDTDEALIGGYDAIRPLKPVLGDSFASITSRLQQAVFERYKTPYWNDAEYQHHKQADNLSAASEAVHVAGWTHAEIKDMLQIQLTPLDTDPLTEIYDCRPWQPWAPDIAAERYLALLEVLKGQGSAARHPGIVFPNSRLATENHQCDLDCRWCSQEPFTCNSQRKCA